MGAYGVSIRKPSDFSAIPKEMLTGNKPCVLDIAIDPEASFPIHGRIAQIRNFSQQ